MSERLLRSRLCGAAACGGGLMAKPGEQSVHTLGERGRGEQRVPGRPLGAAGCSRDGDLTVELRAALQIGRVDL